MNQKHVIKGNGGNWEVVIGLEVHAQITADSKLFSRSPTGFGAEPNSQVSFVDVGMPGMLPTLNERCVHQAIKTGLGINARINEVSIFDRKNYFYPDLPTGYQITQFHKPIVEEGIIAIDLSDGSSKNVRVERIHLEQDAGKSIHDQSPTESFIDLNRAGVGLMEIVSAPDMRSSEEAGQYMKKLRSILRYLGTCDGDMEKGSLRCDANVSVRRSGESKFGTRVEIKNVNSIRNIMRAIDYEAQRQIDEIENGGKILQETRLFDAISGHTRAMRTKEDANDYRYFPDPDLLPVSVSKECIERIKGTMPELPDAKVARYTGELGLSRYDASVIVSEMSTARYFEELSKMCDPKLGANWLTVELFGRLNKEDMSIENSPIAPRQLAKLIGMIQDGTISGKIAKQVFDIMFANSEDPDVIVEREGLVQVSDENAIRKIVELVLAENQEKVAEYIGGKDKLFGFFVGQVMKLSGGKANPSAVNELLSSVLNKK